MNCNDSNQIFQGSDTTGIMLANICLLMAFFPDMQEKIFQELQTVFVTQDQDVTEKEISELVYLDLVIKETLRFWAVLPFFGRKLTQNVDIGKFQRFKLRRKIKLT